MEILFDVRLVKCIYRNTGNVIKSWRIQRIVIASIRTAQVFFFKNPAFINQAFKISNNGDIFPDNRQLPAFIS